MRRKTPVNPTVRRTPSGWMPGVSIHLNRLLLPGAIV